MELKLCVGCDKEQALSEFYFRKDNNNYRAECKKCCLERTARNKINYVRKEENILAQYERNRIKNLIKKDLPIDTPKGFYHQNSKQIDKEYNEAPETIKKLLKLKNYMFLKELRYSIFEFQKFIEKNKKEWMNWDNWNKFKEYDSEKWNDNDQSTWTWRVSFKERKKDITEMWDLSNLQILSCKEDYIYRNEQIRLKRNSTARDKYKELRRTDPKYMVTQMISKSIASMLKNFNSKKSKSSWNYIRFTKEELISYIESKFEWWMTWDNWGKYNSKNWNNNDPTTWFWQLDHIIPLVFMEYNSLDHPNFLKAWAINNLRPLSGKENNYLGGRARELKRQNKEKDNQWLINEYLRLYINKDGIEINVT